LKTIGVLAQWLSKVGNQENECIWESNTIIRYLAASYGKNILWNESPICRTHAERWMDWELATLQPDYIDLFWGYYRTLEKERDISKIEVSKLRCELRFQKLNKHLKSHQYVAGENFTMRYELVSIFHNGN
ncbi:MAG: hypothetical protein P8166_02680, partial [Candidatus Thiodiazotropha sp.]